MKVRGQKSEVRGQRSEVRKQRSEIGFFCLLFSVFCFLSSVFRPLYAQETLTMDLKGIEARELFKILSLKMNKTIVPTKNVNGRVNLFLNNLTFDEALDVVLISQDLACEKKGDIVNIMTPQEYQQRYGKAYNETRRFKLLKTNHAKPSVISAALSEMKSAVGKIVVDEPSGTICLIDAPDKLEEMEVALAYLDQPLKAEIFYLRYMKAQEAKEHLAACITPGIGELFIDERLNKVIVSDFPDRLKKIKELVRALDVEPNQVFMEVYLVLVRLKDEYQEGINWQKEGDLDWTGTFPLALSFTPSIALSADYAQVSIGNLEADRYTATLQLLETFGEVCILSRQDLTIVDKNEARISLVTRQPFVQQALNTNDVSTVVKDKIEFIDIGIWLTLKPEINEDNFVTVTLSAEMSSLKSLTTTEYSVVPIVEKSETDVVSKIKSGTRIIVAGLGGWDIYKTLAGPLPEPLTAPLGSVSRRNRREEFLIFVKPYVHRT